MSAAGQAERPLLGELDLHLFAEGRHHRLWEVLGAHRREDGVAFAVWAPGARAVRVVGDFNGWHGAGHAMRGNGGSGVWELYVAGVPEGCAYQYEIDCADGHTRRKADPYARAAQTPPGTASLVHTSRYTWGDEEWLRQRGGTAPHEGPMAVYELHAGSWRQGLDYRGLAAELPPYLVGLGFTHVEFMPMAEHPFGGSWGYQIASYYAPTSRLGSPDDFRYLVDALHRAGIGVLLDWVPAHFPKDEWALARFDGGPLYEHPDPRRAELPDWGTLQFDYGRPEVRNFLVANALYWLEEFHIDGLRVDAVASMLYLDYSKGEGAWAPNRYGGREHLEAVAFLKELNDTVHERVPGAFTVAEESTAWKGVTGLTAGGLGFDLKWNMGWMHDSLAYLAEDPVHRVHHHHRMTFALTYTYTEHYVLALSHDEVVHLKGSLLTKMHGEDRWRQFAQLRAYLAFMWTHPGKQLLFMGQEFAQPGEWRHEYGLDWDVLAGPAHDGRRHRGMRDLVRDLNHLYRATPALWERDSDPGGFRWIDADDVERNVYSCVRYDHEGTPLVGVFNFSPLVHEDFPLALPWAGAWREVLNTDAASYGGSGVGNLGTVRAVPVPRQGLPAHARLVLPPLAGLWLAAPRRRGARG